MNTLDDLNAISDDDLLHRLARLVERSRRIDADLVAHIGEVDHRKLYAREATPSMFAYCTKILHLSEYEAYMRIAVARASRKHPVLLSMLRDGRLHLSAIHKLAPQLDALDDAGRSQLLKRATHQTKRQVEELIAAVAPKPDVPTTIRKLPQREMKATPAQEGGQLGLDQVASQSPTTDPTRSVHPDQSVQAPQATPPQDDSSSPTHVISPAEPATVEPLAAARYKVTFTCTVELRDKLDRLQALMPDCELAAVIEIALTEKLTRVEARRFGKTKSPRKGLDDTDISAGSRHIPAAVKREVDARDGGQCTFVGADGRRCGARRFLEFHHDKPFALGGDRSPGNIRLLCSPHNALLAESTYGKNVMAKFRRSSVHHPPRPELSG